MKDVVILYPILAHILLILGLYILLILRKVTAIKEKRVDLKVTALNNKAWPDSVVKVSNNMANQFESPILFYVLCIIIFLTGASNIFVMSLAWLYIALRYVHAYIHTGSNFVPYRLRVFALSLVVILVLLIQIIIHTMTTYIPL